MSQEQSWKEEFDKRWYLHNFNQYGVGSFVTCGEEVKSFIESEKQKSFEAGKEEMAKTIHEGIKNTPEQIRQESRTATLKECIEIGEKERVEMKETHICIFNDGKENCDCYLQALSDYQEQLEKLLKGEV